MEHEEVSTLLSITDTQEWSQKATEVQNKKMHAINRNIDSRVMIVSKETREESIARDFIHGRHSEPI